MKKMMKIAAMITLALSLVFTSTMLAEAAMVRNIGSNIYRFEFDTKYGETSVYVGQTVGATLLNDINGNDVTWKSSNKKIATVDKYGNVKGKKAGKVTITAMDGVHTAKCKFTVKALKKAKKNEVVLNYGNDTVFELGKTYTIKTLKGSPVKKIVKDKFNKVNGAKVTFTDGVTDTFTCSCTEIILKNYQRVELFSRVNRQAEYFQCEKIIKRDMAEAGITMNSTDLEKAMFIYNWVGMNVDPLAKKVCNGCRSRGNFCGILHGTGDCDVCAETVDIIADIVGLWTISIDVPKHQFNGIRVDGEWYVMDTMQCEAWSFALGNNVHFLKSYAREVELDSAMDFEIDEDSLDDITFTSTKYDYKSWPEYYDLYVEVNQPETMNDDYWN